MRLGQDHQGAKKNKSLLNHTLFFDDLTQHLNQNLIISPKKSADFATIYDDTLYYSVTDYIIEGLNI